MPPFKSRPGAVEPLSLVALVLLVVTLAIGTAVTSNTKQSFEIRREGSVLQATSGCGLDRFGECGGTCGGGTCGWQGSICGCIYPTPTPIPRPTATPVPTSIPTPTSTCDPDAWSAWSTCSAGCGGGTQSRTNQCGTRQTQSCNTQSCSLPSPTPTPVPASYTCTTNGGYCSPEGCGSDICGSGTCAAGKSCCKACPLPTPTSVPSGGGGIAQPTAAPNTCSYTCTSSGICSAEGGTAIVSQVCSSGSTCCQFPTEQPSSPAGQSPLGGAQPTPTPAWAAPAGQSPLGAAPSPTPRPPSAPSASVSSGQCFWGASTCSAFGRYSGSGCTNCPSGVASCCGVVIPASADACLNSVGQHVDTRCVSSTRVAVCRSDKSGYNTQDCAGGWSCSANAGRCAPPPTPTPSLNFNPQTALTPQGTYTVNPTSPTFDTLNPSRSIDYKKYADACTGKTSGTVCGIDGQVGTCSQGAVPLCELVKGPIGGNLVQYRNLAQQAEAAVMGTVSNLPLVGPNRIYQSLQIAASGSQYSIEAMPSDPYGIAGVEIGAVDVALAHYAGLTEIVDASNRLFYQTGLSESQAQEYNAYVANRFGDAATVGLFAVGTAAQITSPFINPETLAGKPVSSTTNNALGGLTDLNNSGFAFADESGLYRSPNPANYSNPSNDRLWNSLTEANTFTRHITGEDLYANWNGLEFDPNYTINPTLVQRVVEDHFIIKEKYGLPPRALRIENPYQYEQELLAVAKREGIPVRPSVEYSEFFAENQNAGGVFNRDFGATVKIPRTAEKMQGYTGTLEHEVIHGMQEKYYPGMPVEVQEYEAYVGANLPPVTTLKEPWRVEALFGENIYGSTKWWYQTEGQSLPWTRGLSAASIQSESLVKFRLPSGSEDTILKVTSEGYIWGNSLISDKDLVNMGVRNLSFSMNGGRTWVTIYGIDVGQ